MDPDSTRLRIAVTDGRGRPVRAGTLTRWLARVAPPRARGELAIALVPDRFIRTLNRRYRGKDRPTDVLSFPPDGPAAPRATNAEARTTPRDSRHLGDVVIARGVARRQARAAGHSYEIELRVLALHGLLHLLGYDHDAPADRGRMRRVEARLRREGGLPEGLIERRGAITKKHPRPAAPASARERRSGPATTKKRLRPARAAGGPRRDGVRPPPAAPASARERGWGPATTKK